MRAGLGILAETIFPLKTNSRSEFERTCVGNISSHADDDPASSASAAFAAS